MLKVCACSSWGVSLARFVSVSVGDAPLSNAVLRRRSVGLAINYKLAVDDHCRHLRHPDAPGINKVLLSQSQISLQALRIATLETLLHDCGGLLRVRRQSFRQLELELF
ncbi:hypothetical protein ALQ32_200012 [Pseudomonas syringae pv. tagetis]|uniref:Uncharacterized protein n=1 Tax=Pseudomonas syringae pv. tagetis TaxID=129140 RepID=A0A3M3ZGB9_9PSED|nr:hypothetical protein ALQ32_200012 [Pseudomonas syringae pv. tagetis]